MQLVDVTALLSKALFEVLTVERVRLGGDAQASSLLEVIHVSVASALALGL